MKYLFLSLNLILSAVSLLSLLSIDDIKDMIPCDGCGFFYQNIYLYVLRDVFTLLVALLFSFFIHVVRPKWACMVLYALNTLLIAFLISYEK